MPGVTPRIDINDAERLDLSCRKGDRFSLELELYNPADGSPYDMTNYVSALMYVKRSEKSSVIAAQFSTGGSVATGLITLDPINSKVIVEKLEFGVEVGDYVYDLELTISTGAKQTILYGTITVVQDVTYPIV